MCHASAARVVGGGLRLVAGPPRVLGVPLLVALCHPVQCLLRLVRCLVRSHRPRRGAHIVVGLDSVVPQTPVVGATSAVTHDFNCALWFTQARAFRRKTRSTSTVDGIGCLPHAGSSTAHNGRKSLCTHAMSHSSGNAQTRARGAPSPTSRERATWTIAPLKPFVFNTLRASVHRGRPCGRLKNFLRDATRFAVRSASFHRCCDPGIRSRTPRGPRRGVVTMAVADSCRGAADTSSPSEVRCCSPASTSDSGHQAALTVRAVAVVITPKQDGDRASRPDRARVLRVRRR
jgi:hypothetical protein